jgi:hypothetical protein
MNAATEILVDLFPCRIEALVTFGRRIPSLGVSWLSQGMGFFLTSSVESGTFNL